MTAIVGLIDNGKVWMGGDSAGVNGRYDSYIRTDAKVFRNGDFLIGFTSSFRMGQLLRYKFTPPAQKENQDVFAYMVSDFVDAVRDCLKAGGYARKDNEVEAGGFFLVGYRGRLFQIEDDYQVGECADPYDAVGCGDSFAKGVLFATPTLAPEERINLALSAAAHHSAGVRPPFVILQA